MDDLLRTKYSPLLISELEYYPESIIDLINQRVNFCVYGKQGVGKTTIIKVILDNMGIDYIYFNTYNKSLNDILDSINKKTVLSYFKNCHSVIIFDNFDPELYVNINQHCIFIVNKPMRKLQSIPIKEPSFEYLENLAISIIFLENSSVTGPFNCKNYHTFFSELECSISTNKTIRCEYLFKPDKNVHKQLYLNLPLDKKMIIANQVEDYNNFQLSYISGISSLDKICETLDSISLSTTMEKTEYYPILGLVIPSMSIDSEVKEQNLSSLNVSKKNIKGKYNLNDILWNPMRNTKIKK